LGTPVKVAIALGSNVGDRAGHLQHAISRLRTLLDDVRVSRFYETAPVGTPGPQAPFLNLAVVGDTALSARGLLSALLAIEQERGRERPYAMAPRTLDLDLVLFGEATINEPDLVVPHPRFRERRFVLEPLAEIAPEMTDPATKKTVKELLNVVVGQSPS
jgi:2-amino-4-hydroxy-6-hydroxymethyldihydropteridine diphosphokinase